MWQKKAAPCCCGVVSLTLCAQLLASYLIVQDICIWAFWSYSLYNYVSDSRLGDSEFTFADGMYLGTFLVILMDFIVNLCFFFGAEKKRICELQVFRCYGIAVILMTSIYLVFALRAVVSAVNDTTMEAKNVYYKLLGGILITIFLYSYAVTVAKGLINEIRAMAGPRFLLQPAPEHIPSSMVTWTAPNQLKMGNGDANANFV